MMAGYEPLYVAGYETGLVQNREEFLLPGDAYPVLQNAFLFREQLKRRNGLQFIGRLQRVYKLENIGVAGASPWMFNIYTAMGITPEQFALINNGSVEIYINTTDSSKAITGISISDPARVTCPAHGYSNGDRIYIQGVNGMIEVNEETYTISVIDANTFFINASSLSWTAYTSGGTATKITGFDAHFIDNGDGTFSVEGSAVSGTINYQTGDVTITYGVGAGQPVEIDFGYFPGLPVMGIRTRELNTINDEMTVVFDTKYAYIYNGTEFQELPSATPTTWTGEDYNFFWSTNYWNVAGNKLFWVTNFSGVNGDPIRYYDSATWTDFAPTIDGVGNKLTQALGLLPFRGRLLAFNTLEGPTLAGSSPQFQRIRWSQIGNPLLTDSWRDDIPGKGGFLDIPTSQNITAFGFVRDNLVIYCERSTWQLRYTGRSVAPFQIERVNSELGAWSTFSAVQFDTSLVGVGDKGVVECDSYKSDRIDIKIPDLVYFFNSIQNNAIRVHGLRDYQQRLAYWIYPFSSDQIDGVNYFPNRRLVYNYENDSWAVFTDSLTALGVLQADSGITWEENTDQWQEANYPWNNRPENFPSSVAGNQQGFVLDLSNNISPQVQNGPTLFIQDIVMSLTTPALITSPYHNLVTGQVIVITQIPTGTSYDILNNGVYSVVVSDSDPLNKFYLWKYNSTTDEFSDPVLGAPGTFVAGGVIATRDNFIIQSKKFSYLDKGQNIQLGYIDVLLQATTTGAIALQVFGDYYMNQPVNTRPENSANDLRFNQVIPTSQQGAGLPGSKFFQRVYCPFRSSFITLIYTFNNAQMAGPEYNEDVQIDAQILWVRKAGRLQS